MIKDRHPRDKETVFSQVQRSDLPQATDIEAGGWLFDVLNCVNQIPKDTFTLQDIYQYESALKLSHPQNNNVRAKIRQQLQLLRDRGFLEFTDRGSYRKIGK